MLYSADLASFSFNCAQKQLFFEGSVQEYYYYVQKYCPFPASCRNITAQEPSLPGFSCRANFGRVQKYSPLLWSALAELGVEGAISLSKLIGRPAPRGPVMHIMLGVDTDGKNTNYEEELPPYADTSLHSYPSATEEIPKEIAGKVQGPEAHLVCSECSERFSSDTSLRAHMADLHTIVQCPQCGLEVSWALSIR